MHGQARNAAQIDQVPHKPIPLSSGPFRLTIPNLSRLLFRIEAATRWVDAQADVTCQSEGPANGTRMTFDAQKRNGLAFVKASPLV